MTNIKFFVEISTQVDILRFDNNLKYVCKDFRVDKYLSTYFNQIFHKRRFQGPVLLVACFQMTDFSFCKYN